MTSHGHKAASVEPAFLEQGHESVGCVEGDTDSVAIIDQVGQQGDCKPLLPVLLDDLSVRQTTRQGEAVELGVGFVRHVCLVKEHVEKAPEGG